jgi:hypothetical protein
MEKRLEFLGHVQRATASRLQADDFAGSPPPPPSDDRPVVSRKDDGGLVLPGSTACAQHRCTVWSTMKVARRGNMAPNRQRPARPREKVRPPLDLSQRARRNEEGRRPPTAPSREAGRSPARSGTRGAGRPHSSPAQAWQTEPRRLRAPWRGGRSRGRLPTLAGRP